MTPENIERVFGRSRLKMVTGEHVEVFREEALPGERRRYTKRFLSSMGADFRHWTEREWRILARLVGHGIGPVPDVVQFDRGAGGGAALVQTYDAGITVDHWATLLPVERDGVVLRHVFEDCAHWWALARHGLIALDAIHELQLVHLDLKADNVCIPYGPPDFDPARPEQIVRPLFEQIALIDFAFSLVSGEPLKTAFPIGHQAEFDYQSPRLLHALEAGRHGNLLPTRQLDWRCDVFSLAAMLRRYLPGADTDGAGGWTRQRLAVALSLVRRLVDAHDRGTPAQRPHKELIEIASRALRDKDLAASLARGWRLARDAGIAAIETRTPVTRIALPINAAAAEPVFAREQPPRKLGDGARRAWWVAGIASAGALAVPLLGEAWLMLQRDGSAVPASAQADSKTPAAKELVAQAPVDATPAPAALPASAATPMLVSPAVPASAAMMAPTPASAPTAAQAPAATPTDAPPAPATVPAKAEVAAAVPRAAPPPAVAALPRPAARFKPKPVVVVRKPSAPSAAPRVTLAPAPPFAAAAGPVRKRGPVATPAPAPLPAPTTVVAAAAAPAAPAVTTISMPSATTSNPLPAPLPAPISVPAPAVTPVKIAEPPAPQLPDDFSMRAAVLMAEHMPQLAQRAERRVLRALHVAAQADNPWQNAEIVDAAKSARLAPDETLPMVAASSVDAKLLSDAADAAFWNERNPQHALNLQTRAFGADPHNAVIAANLAFYYLKQRPARAEAARQLALYALTMPDPRFPQGRIEDWTNFAIASALVGRERDARNALFVTLALSPSVDRQCRNAVAAVTLHGERMRAPTEAMLARIRTWGRSQESSFCRWPPSWWAGVRSP